MKKAVAQHLSKDLTSYDFLKSLAVATIIIDHIGIYFFPEQMGWRVVGCLSLPLWLFWVGCSNSREITPKLYWGAAILFISDIIFGQSIFPLNILVTIMIVRILIDYVMQFTLSGFQNMFLGVVALVILVFPTLFIFEYGTQAVLFAMFGYMVRHQKKLGFSNEYILIFMFVALFVYVAFQKVVIGFGTTEFYTMAAGVLLVGLVLSGFEPKLYPELSARWPAFLTELFKLMGRHTLEIYVIHLVLFKMAALWLFSERFGLFQWSFF